MAGYVVSYPWEVSSVKGRVGGAEEAAEPRVDWEVLDRGNRFPWPVLPQGLWIS